MAEILSFAKIKSGRYGLDRIAWTFGHDYILPHPAIARQCPRFQTETLPKSVQYCADSDLRFVDTGLDPHNWRVRSQEFSE